MGAPQETAQGGGEFQAACAKGRLIYHRCKACRTAQLPLAGVCVRCRSPDLATRRSAGKGVVYSLTTVHRAPSPAFAADTPYVLALVAMDEGFRLMVRLPGAAAIGDPAEIVLEPGPDGIVRPQGRLAKPGGDAAV